jgi:hypothetical protein
MISVDRYNAALPVVRCHKSNGVRPDDARFALTTQPNGFKSVTWLDSEELAARRTAWRAEQHPVNAAGVEWSQVLTWLQAGGGDIASAVRFTGSSEDVVRETLARMHAAGELATRRRLAWPGRR